MSKLNFHWRMTCDLNVGMYLKVVVIRLIIFIRLIAQIIVIIETTINIRLEKICLTK